MRNNILKTDEVDEGNDEECMNVAARCCRFELSSDNQISHEAMLPRQHFVRFRSISGEELSRSILSGKYITIALVDQYKLRKHDRATSMCLEDVYTRRSSMELWLSPSCIIHHMFEHPMFLCRCPSRRAGDQTTPSLEFRHFMYMP
ncbi:hypothetical protein V6N11_047122 [Hibiscus sabdariffa]|uniref:Uncharacterized protein n=1 Tax=Hibiscus sabdariffa TaxID=183260 RepID=A0ABR2AD67_9ROSI